MGYRKVSRKKQGRAPIRGLDSKRSFFKIFISQLFLGFGYLMAAIRDDKLAMHDLFAKTVIVLQKSRPTSVVVSGDESTT